METFARFQEILNDPSTFVKDWKARNGRPIIGTFLSDVPEEIIYASGCLPFALLSGRKITRGEGSIPSFACSLTRNTFNQAYFHELEFLDGVVIPHLCDSSRGLSHIWEKNFPSQFSELLRLPKKLNSQGTKKYLQKELKRFKEALEKAFETNISNKDIWRSIETYNENRKYLRMIQAIRSQNFHFMSNYDFFSLVKASMLMPKEEHNQIAKNLLTNVESTSQETETSLPVRVFLSGKLVEPLEIFQWMDETGILVVDDDLAIGSRYFSYDVPLEVDALDALAESYFHRIPSALVEGTEERLSYILNKVREHGLQGVIFVQLKFCEPLTFDYPDLKKGLDREGIPSLFIETEIHSLALGQLKTRLQAFAEIIWSKE